MHQVMKEQGWVVAEISVPITGSIPGAKALLVQKVLLGDSIDMFLINPNNADIVFTFVNPPRRTKIYLT
jgi:hypothetical protein